MSMARLRARAAAIRASGLPFSARAVFGGERLADRLEIVAGIKPFRDRADVFAERLAVAQEGRAREHVDLRAGIVDVVFARDLVAGEGEQVGERVAEHRAAAMADMHRPGRVGRDIFDIDRLALPDIAAPIIARRLRAPRAARRSRLPA